MSAEEFTRFMRLVDVASLPGACWEWKGNKPGGRHGHFSVGRRSVKAHRWIYEAIIGSIPHGQVVRHKCDNPSCVNPEHLELGSHADNVADMHERGRNADRRGGLHPLALLTEAQVLEIRRLAQCGYRQHLIAKQFEVSRQHVGKIVRRENWGHI